MAGERRFLVLAEGCVLILASLPAVVAQGPPPPANAPGQETSLSAPSDSAGPTGPAAAGMHARKAGEMVEISIGKGCKVTFVYVPAGTFNMGTPPLDGGDDDERPQSTVRISKGYWMGQYKVTISQWNTLMTENQAKGRASDAVGGVSWGDCREFVDRLNSMNIGTFRMPTEAEWEYACRSGGEGVKYGRGNIGSKLYHEATRPTNCNVCDMIAAIQEWCQDWYGRYPDQPQVDPSGPPSGSKRVVRGLYVPNPKNGIILPGYGILANRRSSLDPDKKKASVGFRLVAEDEERFSATSAPIMD